MNLEALRSSSPLLTKLSNTELGFFESISHEVHLGSGEVLFEEGSQADTFFIISQGKVGLEITTPGKAPMIIQTLGPGDLVGLSWFFPPYRWNWHARAMADTSLVAFDAGAVRQKCEENRDLALEVLGVVASELAARLHRTRIQLLDLYRAP
ncbi:MAG TPA: cyclic nucleotide-binding domain-containing protein [Acidimicrobiia bacterium]|nr:cyclic nucleotide-binding domain-containing protein [Acidimicrobiia bacterium]